MPNALTISVQALHNDQSRMDGISRNLANVSTLGYKGETFVAKPFADVMQASAGAVTGELPVPQAQAAIDRRSGGLKFTGNPLDLAIEGDGFFEVSTAAGPAYTRQGRFQVDARGRLVTEAGDPVAGKRGDILLTGTRPVIDRQGNVTDNGRVVGQIKAVRIPAAVPLERLGSGLMRAQGSMTEVDANMQQGFVETSNVSSMTEMVRMVETMRHFEATQKVVQAYDEMLDKALRKLGDL